MGLLALAGPLAALSLAPPPVHAATAAATARSEAEPGPMIHDSGDSGDSADAADAADAADTEDTADELSCVALNATSGASEIALRFTNNCGHAVACEISWELYCGEDDARMLHRGGGAGFSLRDGMSHTVTAAATACGDEAWEIAGESWSCRPLRTESVR